VTAIRPKADAAVRPGEGATSGEVPRPVSRRVFLRRAALGGATVAVAGTGALAYRAYDEGVFATGRGGAYRPWRHWQDWTGPEALVAAAVLAANPHNTQAWQFGISPSRIEVYMDLDRRIGSPDPIERELHVGLGCALENLCLAGPANGYETAVTLAPTGDPSLAATVTLGPGGGPPGGLYRAIPARHSDRAGYQARPVPGELLDEMSRLADATAAPAELRWFSAGVDRDGLGRLLVEATEAFVADRQQSEDAYRWFRHDWDAVQAHRDGLTIDTQGLDDLTRAAAKLLPATSRTAGDRFWLDRTRDVHVATAAAFGVVTVPDPDDLTQRLAGGRLLQRIHLFTAGHGLALQHMNQITERADRERQLGLDAVFGAALDDLLAR
jgi:hypothetical protein